MYILLLKYVVLYLLVTQSTLPVLLVLDLQRPWTTHVMLFMPLTE